MNIVKIIVESKKLLLSHVSFRIVLSKNSAAYFQDVIFW